MPNLETTGLRNKTRTKLNRVPLTHDIIDIIDGYNKHNNIDDMQMYHGKDEFLVICAMTHVIECMTGPIKTLILAILTNLVYR
jgi:hypothetical protein